MEIQSSLQNELCFQYNNSPSWSKLKRLQKVVEAEGSLIYMSRTNSPSPILSNAPEVVLLRMLNRVVKNWPAPGPSKKLYNPEVILLIEPYINASAFTSPDGIAEIFKVYSGLE